MKITISATVNASPAKVWECWTKPEHVTHWNFASPEWHCPRGENDLRPGGIFSFRMEAKDGSMGFDFGGTYTEVVNEKKISYKLGDERTVTVLFDKEGSSTIVTETFDTEDVNAAEMQRAGWQAILDNFKKYTESKFTL